jgi:glycosidase
MRRRLSLLVVLAILASLFTAPGLSGVATAATFRTLVAQVPANPGTGSVRIWMNSDTAFGETAGIEYNPVGTGTYVKVLGSYDTSYPGANWRADIPGQPAGTQIRYQLFTRNQSGQDYGFTGFNWSYSTSGAACAGASVGDDNVFYSGLLHDSFSTSYRAPLGPVPATPGTVTLRFRTCQNDVQSATLRVWNDRLNTEALYPMTPDGNATDPNIGPVSFWRAELPITNQPTILYYTFRASDGSATGYYRDDDVKFLGGGFGQAEANQGIAEANSYQISVFSPGFSTPEWMQRAVIYQIFPDRFRDGDPSNNPTAGRFSYARADGAIVRSNNPQGEWNTTVCDPRGQQGAGHNCPNYYGDNFYGGDLAGITQKIQDGYFTSLGVTLLYFNPIFRAPSNHKYDTANFLEIDPDFGTLADFQSLVAAANARGIRIMLDGVFNHTSSDSPYFDRYSRYNAAGQLVNPNGGANDGSGACEAVSAQYRSWFYFEGDPGTTISNPGSDGGTIVRCADENGNFTRSYEAWYGYASLPKIRSGLPAVRNYFYGSASAVGPYWTAQGASGWRFDVGADVDPGLTNDPSNDYWEGFRAAVRNPALTGRSDTVMLGEEWGDASAWLLGDEWDSVMNYRFRSAVLAWLFTGCSGNGCTGGTKFQENDSNDYSSSGAIFALSPSQFNARLRSIHEDYPANAFKSMMNLAGSHDTQRVRFLLKKINNDSDAAAVQRMKEWWLFAFTYPGAPTLYYGDEVGLSHDGVWDGSQFQDDPYNRTPFPWPDASGSAYVPDTTNLQAFARHMASIRHSYRALQDGDVQHGLVINDAQGLYGFARTNGQQTALVLLNRSGAAQTGTFSGLNAAPYNLPDGTVLVDVISGATYSVTNGSVAVNVTPTWGAVLLEQNKIETPAAPSLSASASGNDVRLSWPMTTSDSAGGLEVVTRYEVYRSTTAGFTPGGAPLATLANPAFGGDPSFTDTGAASGGFFYIIRACNAAGTCADSAAIAPTPQATTLGVDAASGTFGGTATLQATLAAGANPLANRTVSFSLNGASVGSATTNAQGVASLSGVSLSGINAGSYPGGVTANFAGDTAYNSIGGSAVLSVAKADQTVTLSGVPASITAPQSFTVSASASSGLPVSLSVSGSCSLSGTTVTTSGAGTCIVTASQDGDDNYNQAASVSQSATVTEQVTNAAVSPVLECVATNGDGSYTARFGYLNRNSAGVIIAVGSNNRFTPNPIDRGQVTTFAPGRVVDAFRVTWSGGNLVWSLRGPDGRNRTSTASPTSKPCS